MNDETALIALAAEIGALQAVCRVLVRNADMPKVKRGLEQEFAQFQASLAASPTSESTAQIQLAAIQKWLDAMKS